MGKLTADSQQSRGEVEKFKSSRVREFESSRVRITQRRRERGVTQRRSSEEEPKSTAPSAPLRAGRNGCAASGEQRRDAAVVEFYRGVT